MRSIGWSQVPKLCLIVSSLLVVLKSLDEIRHDADGCSKSSHNSASPTHTVEVTRQAEKTLASRK